jgi:hypothetical protein
VTVRITEVLRWRASPGSRCGRVGGGVGTSFAEPWLKIANGKGFFQMRTHLAALGFLVSNRRRM